MVTVNHVVFTENHRPFDTVFQLPDVARPMIAHENVNGSGRYSSYPLEIDRIILFNEVVCKKQDVRFAFAQWGHGDRENVQTVVEIFPEFSVPDFLLEISVCGGNYPDVGFKGFRPSYPLKLFFLKNTQQFCLYRQAEFTDFIKEYCSAVGKFKPSLPACRSTGK